MLSGRMAGASAAARAARPAEDCRAANRKIAWWSCSIAQATEALQRWQTPSNRISGGWLPGMRDYSGLSFWKQDWDDAKDGEKSQAQKSRIQRRSKRLDPNRIWGAWLPGVTRAFQRLPGPTAGLLRSGDIAIDTRLHCGD